MKKSIKILGVVVLVLVLVAVFLTSVLKKAGGSLDVVGKESVTTFETVLNSLPENVAADEKQGGWALTAPDGSVRFIWSKDFGKSPLYDVLLEFDAAPFVSAGLDPEKLPQNYRVDGDNIVVGRKLGDAKSAATTTALAAYQEIVGKYRSAVGYHGQLDHYNIDLGGGNLFEWAKDFAKNGATGENQDKDIVFVLNPDPFTAAGVDPANVEGWVYGEVVVDIDNKPTNVMKFLKPFNIK
ncbi:MAG: hypothetical protein LBQ97_04075 [Fusobacteriaceae bacterium]|jgi:hypothetical protein|nr:hypothetical protein [Fusobacteriaceae bacterium]